MPPAERGPHEHVAVRRDRDAIGAAALVIDRERRRRAGAWIDLRCMRDLEQRIGAHAGEVQRVARIVPRERARLSIGDLRVGLRRPRAGHSEAEERDVVGDRGRELGAAVVALVGRAIVGVDWHRALERHDRLAHTEEQHRERRGSIRSRARAVRSRARRPARARRLQSRPRRGARQSRACHRGRSPRRAARARPPVASAASPSTRRTRGARDLRRSSRAASHDLARARRRTARPACASSRRSRAPTDRPRAPRRCDRRADPRRTPAARPDRTSKPASRPIGRARSASPPRPCARGHRCRRRSRARHRRARRCASPRGTPRSPPPASRRRSARRRRGETPARRAGRRESARARAGSRARRGQPRGQRGGACWHLNKRRGATIRGGLRVEPRCAGWQSRCSCCVRATATRRGPMARRRATRRRWRRRSRRRAQRAHRRPSRQRRRHRRHRRYRRRFQPAPRRRRSTAR